MVYQKAVNIGVSTHSRLKAAGSFTVKICVLFTVSTHSRLKAAGTATGSTICAPKFQHTAA